jgi:hypothetical protein
LLPGSMGDEGGEEKKAKVENIAAYDQPNPKHRNRKPKRKSARAV